MSTEKKETTQERLERMKREREAAAKKTGNGDNSLVDQLTHTDTGEPNFEKLAKQLKERKKQKSKGKNDGYIKDTIYIREDIYEAFNALSVERGQKKEFTNQAFADFIVKKTKELGLDK